MKASGISETTTKLGAFARIFFHPIPTKKTFSITAPTMCGSAKLWRRRSNSQMEEALTNLDFVAGKKSAYEGLNSHDFL